MRYIRYKIEKQQINFLNCNKIDEWIDSCHTRETEFIDVCLGYCECGSTVGSGNTSGDTTGSTSGCTIYTTVRGNGSESVCIQYSITSKKFDELLIDGISVDTRTTTYIFNDNEIHNVDYIGVQNIEHFFRDSDIITAVITDGLTSIGTSAFNGCKSLTSVTIPSSVTSIGYSAFYRCGLKSVTIPDSVQYIGRSAFSSCTSLKSITCLAKTAPYLSTSVFDSLPPYGILYVPHESNGYESWLDIIHNHWSIRYFT